MILATVLVFAGLAAAGTDTVVTPTLLLETPDRAIRDITVAPDGSIFTYDYQEYRIRKFDRHGRFLLEFGGKGSADGQFTHLTGIRALADRLLAIDSVGVSAFDLDGRFLSKRAFTEEVTPNFSAALADGRYVGFQIVAPELKAVLTFRSPEGRETDRLASHDLREFFPELKKGEDFFLSDEYARTYLYAADAGNDVLWSASDALRVYRYRDGRSQLVLTEDLTPVPLADADRAALQARKAKVRPPLYLYVPERYPLVRHLAVGTDGDLWIVVRSQEKTGVLHYSTDGAAKGFATMPAEFDMTRAVVRVFGDRMFFIVGKTVHVADLSAQAIR